MKRLGYFPFSGRQQTEFWWEAWMIEGDPFAPGTLSQSERQTEHPWRRTLRMASSGVFLSLEECKANLAQFITATKNSIIFPMEDRL